MFWAWYLIVIFGLGMILSIAVGLISPTGFPRKAFITLILQALGLFATLQVLGWV